MKALDFTALTLVIVGAINWGLIGFFKFDLISTIFGGETSIISRIIYAIVGLAGLYSITTYSKMNSNDMVIGNQH
ncbi:MAG: DUF378 domain-containing protein [Eubacterium sp.]|nr:DUF378 domain-containing protein [Eubacterium sp.]